MSAGRPWPGRGLAAERTALAWRRSLAGLLGIALLLGRGTLTRWPLPVAAAVTCLAAVVVLLAVMAGQRRYWSLRQPAPGPLATAGVAALTCAVLVTALLGAALLLTT